MAPFGVKVNRITGHIALCSAFISLRFYGKSRDIGFPSEEPGLLFVMLLRYALKRGEWNHVLLPHFPIIVGS